MDAELMVLIKPVQPKNNINPFRDYFARPHPGVSKFSLMIELGCRSCRKLLLSIAKLWAENSNYVLYFVDFFCKHELCSIKTTAFTFEDYSDFE